LAETDRKGVDGVVPGSQGHGHKTGPTPVHTGEILVDHGLSSPVAIQARAFLGLDLEKLHDPELFAGRSQDA
jgi:hypothetical protein